MSRDLGSQYGPSLRPGPTMRSTVSRTPPCRRKPPPIGDGRDERHHRRQLEGNRTALDRGLLAFRQEIQPHPRLRRVRPWSPFPSIACCNVAGSPAIYRSGTEVLPAHQGRGLYGFFTSEVLKCSGSADRGDASVLYGWRTRNPIVWAANAKICEKVTPSLLGDAQDPTLQAACIEMCSSLYPGKPLELPGMIMRGAYGHIKYHRQDYHGMASLVDAAMSRIIPDSADALFSVGYARV